MVSRFTGGIWLDIKPNRFRKYAYSFPNIAVGSGYHLPVKFVRRKIKMCGLKCLSMLSVILAVSIDRQTVAAVPVPNIIDGPRAHSLSDIPVAIEGKAQALLDEEVS